MGDSEKEADGAAPADAWSASFTMRQARNAWSASFTRVKVLSFFNPREVELACVQGRLAAVRVGQRESL